MQDNDELMFTHIDSCQVIFRQLKIDIRLTIDHKISIRHQINS